MKLRTTIILLVMFAVVGGAWWLTRGLGSAPMQDPAQTDPDPVALFPEGTLDVAMVDRFEITRLDNDLAVFKRIRGRWYLTDPIWFPADATAVNQLLQSIAALRDQGPAETYLKSHSLARVFLHGDGDTRVVTFNDTVGGGLGRVQLDGGEPRLVDDILHGFLKRYHPTDLLSKQLATPNAFNTDTVVIQTQDATTRLDREDERWWINEDPAQPALSDPVPGCIDVAGYLNIPNATKIERFIIPAAATIDPAAYGLSPAVARARLTYDYRDAEGQQRSATLTIGAPADPEASSYYAMFTRPERAGSVVFVLPAEFSIVLAKTADDFRDPRVFTIAPEQAQHVELLDGWSLALTDERGSVIDPQRARSGLSAELRTAMVAVLTARSRDFANVHQSPNDWEEAARLRITPTRGGEPELVVFYRPVLPEETSGLAPGFDHYMAVRGEEAVGRRIPAATVEALLGLGALALPFENAQDQ